MSTERLITVIAGVIVVLAAYWFLLLSPKLQTNRDLGQQVASLRASAAQAEQAAATGAAEKRGYHKNYASLVRLGKAVPADSDTPSFLTQVSGISDRAGIELDGLTLGESSASGTPAPTTTSATTTAPATETAAALLPLGASVGPAGLAVMPYDVTFKGDYFQTAKLIGGLDGLVHLRKSKQTADFSDPRPSGRLATINSFSLSSNMEPGAAASSVLDGTLSMTTYLAPPDQGLTGGATASSPVPATTPATSSGSSPAVTAAVTP